MISVDEDSFDEDSFDEDSFDETARTVDFNVRLTEPTNKDVVLNVGTLGNATLGQDSTLSPASSIGQSEARIQATIRPDATAAAIGSLRPATTCWQTELREN